MHRTLLFILLLPFLAGCTSEGIPAQCRDQVLRPPAVGESFTYQAAGLFWTPAIHVGIADWTLANGGAAGQPNDSLRLDEGSTLTVIALQASPILNFSGAIEPAHTLQHIIARPQSNPLHFADEHISNLDGAVVSVDQRAMWQQKPGMAVHADRLQRRDYPAGLGSSHLWGQSVAEWPETFTVRSDRPLPTSEATWMGIQTTVLKVDATCQITVQTRYEDPSKPTAHITTATYDGAPLPLRYSVQVLANDGAILPDEAFTAVRTEYAPSHGTTFTPWSRTPADSHTMIPLQPSEHGFPAGPAPGFDHTVAEALTAASADDTVRAWKSQHPDAVLHAVEHRDGEPGTNVQDQWLLHFADTEASLRTTVTYTDPLLSGLQSGIQVEARPRPDGIRAIPAVPDRIPSLATLGALHEWAYGQPAEVLLCELTESFCAVGTHNNTDRLRAGANGGTPWAHLGMVLGTTDGLLYQRDALVPWSV